MFKPNPLNSLTRFDLLGLIRGAGYESCVALNVKIAKILFIIPLKSLVSSAFAAQIDDILHFSCQSDDCGGSEALFKINSQHNAAHTDPLSLGQDYETEAECIPELNLTGRQGCQVADLNLNCGVTLPL